jgi:FolB domain-containing protein
MIKTRLELKDWQLNVFLGCHDWEQLQPQLVSIDINLIYAQAPLGCQSDNLKETNCYASLLNNLSKHLHLQKFNLIEHLAYKIYSLCKEFILTDDKISIKITKQLPQLNLRQGASFYYGDEI